MSRVDKAGEPSMEEILASIRKIISEEPAGQPAPDAPNGATASDSRPETVGLTASAAQIPAPVFPAKRDTSGPPGVDDVLDDLVSEPAPSASAPAPRLEPGVPSWLFPKTAAAGAPPESSKSSNPADPAAASTGPSQAGRGSDLGAFVPGRLEASLPKERDTSSEQRRQPIPGLTPQSARPADQAIPHISFGPPAAAAGESGKARVSADPSAERMAAGPAPGAADDKPTIKVPAPSKQTPVAEAGGLSPTAPKAAENGLLKRAEAARPAMPTLPSTSPSSASGSGAFGIGGARPLGASSSSPSGAVATGAKPPLDSLRATPSPASGGEAVSNTASASTGSGAGSSPTASPVSTGGTLPATPPSQPPLVKEPTIKATVTGQAAPAASKPVASATAATDGARTLEDTVVELLRPMLRQWLDANLPRIVEKAVRVELAETGKKKH